MFTGRNFFKVLPLVFLSLPTAIRILFARRSAYILVITALRYANLFERSFKISIKDVNTNRVLILQKDLLYCCISPRVQINAVFIPMTQGIKILASLSSPYFDDLRFSFKLKTFKNRRVVLLKLCDMRINALGRVAKGTLGLIFKKDNIKVICKQFSYPVTFLTDFFSADKFFNSQLYNLKDHNVVSFGIALKGFELKSLNINHYKFFKDLKTKDLRGLFLNEIEKHKFINRDSTISAKNIKVVDTPKDWNRIVKEITLFAEDPFFFEHSGFSNDSLVVALNKNLKAKKIIKGGSTISNQFCKNIFLNHERSLKRKIKEAILTALIENKNLLTKEEILTFYLQIIELGPNIWGVDDFAETILGKVSEDLDLYDAMFLSYVVPRPSVFIGNFHKDGALNKILKNYFYKTLHGLHNRRLINENVFTNDLKQIAERTKFYEQLIWRKTSKLNIQSLVPELQVLAQKLVALIELKLGVEVAVISGYRTCEEQDKLFSSNKGVTNAKGGESLHNFGRAFDLVPISENFVALWDFDRWQEIGRLGKTIGLFWGGDFEKINDYGHFEIALVDG